MDKSGWVCSETPLRPTDGLLKIRFERTRGAPFSSKLGGYGPKSGCCARIKTKIRPFLPKTGWVSAGMALFSHEKRDTFYWIFYRNQWVGMLRFIQKDGSILKKTLEILQSFCFSCLSLEASLLQETPHISNRININRSFFI
jgi:hypothetical protein